MNSEWREIEDRRLQMQDSSRRLFVLGAAVAVSFLAAAHYFGKSKNQVASAPVLEAEVVQLPVVQAPQVDRSARPASGTRSASAGRQSYVAVYECVSHGQRVVSDQPCGADAQARTLVIDQPDPANVARQRYQTWAAQQGSGATNASSAPVSGGASSARTVSSSDQALCDSIEREIQWIDARMRQGYRSWEGERYRERLRALKEHRYETNCLAGR